MCLCFTRRALHAGAILTPLGLGLGWGEGRCMGLLFRVGERDSRLNLHWEADFLPIPWHLECLYSGRLMCSERCKYRRGYHHIIHVTIPTRGWNLLWVCSKITEQSLFSITVSRVGAKWLHWSFYTVIFCAFATCYRHKAFNHWKVKSSLLSIPACWVCEEALWADLLAGLR